MASQTPRRRVTVSNRKFGEQSVPDYTGFLVLILDPVAPGLRDIGIATASGHRWRRRPRGGRLDRCGVGPLGVRELEANALGTWHLFAGALGAVDGSTEDGRVIILLLAAVVLHVGVDAANGPRDRR
jgi:hypothetical protein